ncbi:MAG TPA: putative Ig domain-containing protein [Frankiaceae bacterium]|nr:putative Ig domain-containing protein [Frankiaceae bacterium]
MTTLVLAVVGLGVVGVVGTPAAASADTAESIGPYITDVKVITGSSPDIACPTSYHKQDTDLNLHSGGDYVYACVEYGSDPTQGISQLYVTYQSGPNPANLLACTGDDQLVSGDLNSGVINSGDILGGDHEALYFCIHRPNTSGGSAFTINPGSATTDTAVPQNKLLTAINFLDFSFDKPPACSTTGCVDAGPSAFGYLFDGQTIEPYCQKSFGTDSHPLFNEFEYHPSSGDLSDPVPADSTVMELNAGGTADPNSSYDEHADYLYACGTYLAPDTVAPILRVSAFYDGTQREYTAGDWTNQAIYIQWSCVDNQGGTGVQGVSPNDTVTVTEGPSYYTGQCTDKAGNTSSATFGPVQIDTGSPFSNPGSITTADGQPYGLFPAHWTNQDVIVHWTCEDGVYNNNNFISGAAPGSFIAPTTIGDAGGGERTIYPGDLSHCTDRAGNAAIQTSLTAPILIDKTAPTLTVAATTADGQPYTAGTPTTQHVTVTFTCTDTLSGVTAGHEQSVQTITAATDSVSSGSFCLDNAGNPASPITFGPVSLPPPLVISTTFLPGGQVGIAYSGQLAATGGTGALNWALAAGSTLPAGLSLDPSGAISGTPTSAAVGNVGFVVTDTATPPVSVPVTLYLAISAAPEAAVGILAPTLPTGVVGQPYTGQLRAFGGSGILSWALADSSSLPRGLSLSPTGAITGTPQETGATTATFVVSDSGGPSTDSATYTLTIDSAPLSVTTASLPAGRVGQPYSAQLASTGGIGAVTWTLAAGARMPSGLALSPAGAISGTPTAIANSQIGFVASDSAVPPQTSVKRLLLTVSPRPVTAPGAPVIGTATPGNGSASVSFTPPTSTGGAPITRFTVTASPGGRTATGARSPITVTGLANGSDYTFTVKATNSAGTGPASSQSSAVKPSVIAGKYAGLGGATSFLGAPLAPEMPVGGGRVRAYQHGAIFYSPATGAHEVHGAILTRYLMLAGPVGTLGFPSTDQITTAGGAGYYNNFAGSGGSSIYWSRATGAWPVRGPIRSRWIALGAERGRLGYPITNDYAVAGGRRSDFQHGAIALHIQSGTTTVTYH